MLKEYCHLQVVHRTVQNRCVLTHAHLRKRILQTTNGIPVYGKLKWLKNTTTKHFNGLPIPDFIGRILNLGRLAAKAGLVTRNAYYNTRQFRINFLDRCHWQRISETDLKSRWKWTEMVKLKEDKQVGQNFIELKHMAVVIMLNYLKTKEVLKNCKAKWLGCVLTLPIYRGREQHGKGR